MKALRHWRKDDVESAAKKGDLKLVEMPFKIAENREDVPILGDSGEHSATVSKRRVQIPLPKTFEVILANIQKRLGLSSYAAVIQTALGFIYHIVKLSKSDGTLWIEGPKGKRAISPFIFIGSLSSNIKEADTVTKYQLMMDRDQDIRMITLMSELEASSAAELIRYSLRILDNVTKSLGESECLVATDADGAEFELNLR